MSLALFSWIPAAYLFLTYPLHVILLHLFDMSQGDLRTMTIVTTLPLVPMVPWVKRVTRRVLNQPHGPEPLRPETSYTGEARLFELPGPSLVRWITRLPPVRLLLRPRLVIDDRALSVVALGLSRQIEYSTVVDGLATAPAILIEQTGGNTLVLRTGYQPRHFGCLITSHELAQVVKAQTIALITYNERLLARVMAHVDRARIEQEKHAARGDEVPPAAA